MSPEQRADKVMVGIHLSPNIAKLLKIQSAVEGKPAGEIVEEALINLLLNPTRQSVTLDEVDRMVDSVRGRLVRLTEIP